MDTNAISHVRSAVRGLSRAMITVVELPTLDERYVIYMPNGAWPEGRTFIPASASFWLVPGGLSDDL